MRFWTADLHIGHANISGYTGRPFVGVDEMNDALIDCWNLHVGASDEVWIVGDFALGKITETLPLVAFLNGRKVLVAGNHDRCWHGHRKGVARWTEEYLAAGFDEVIQGYTTVDIGGHQVGVCHFPYRGDSHGADRYVDHRPVDRGGWLIHGHIHGRPERRVRGRMIDVGVDANGFAPVPDDEIVAIIERGPIV